MKGDVWITIEVASGRKSINKNFLDLELLAELDTISCIKKSQTLRFGSKGFFIVFIKIVLSNSEIIRHHNEDYCPLYHS